MEISSVNWKEPWKKCCWSQGPKSQFPDGGTLRVFPGWSDIWAGSVPKWSRGKSLTGRVWVMVSEKEDLNNGPHWLKWKWKGYHSSQPLARLEGVTVPHLSGVTGERKEVWDREQGAPLTNSIAAKPWRFATYILAALNNLLTPQFLQGDIFLFLKNLGKKDRKRDKESEREREEILESLELEMLLSPSWMPPQSNLGLRGWGSRVYNPLQEGKVPPQRNNTKVWTFRVYRRHGRKPH